MGRAMKNLDKLLAMPYGCGEQNMVLFAPNIFILNYLKSTNQLTQEIQDRATRFLESGELFCSDSGSGLLKEQFAPKKKVQSLSAHLCDDGKLGEASSFMELLSKAVKKLR